MNSKPVPDILPGPKSRWPLVLAAFLVVGVLLVLSRSPSGLVVYCAHDAVYSARILNQFEEQTGIPVTVRFDSEATKSLGLVELLLRERERPRCDVFWNNELLGTVSLARQGLLAPHEGAGQDRIPAQFRDPQGYWTGFGARFRVYIVNTEALQRQGDEPDQAMIARLLGGDLDRVAIARPLYGTTLTHYSLLWQHWGEDRLRAWHHDWRRRGVCEVAGNATVKDLVAAGVCELGLTDSDDYFLARDHGQPVTMVPVRLDGQTIAIPNTVAIIRGSRHLDQARHLVDFLVSEQTELALAHSPSRQVPLGPVAEQALPAEVVRLRRLLDQAAPLHDLDQARDACLAWLKASS